MTRHVQIRLEQPEYEQFENTARAGGLSLQAAGRQAVLQWLSAASDSAIGALTAPEKRLLLGVLGYLRRQVHAPEREVLVRLLDNLTLLK